MSRHCTTTRPASSGSALIFGPDTQTAAASLSFFSLCPAAVSTSGYLQYSSLAPPRKAPSRGSLGSHCYC